MAEIRIPARLRKVLPWAITAIILWIVFQKVDFRETVRKFDYYSVRNVGIVVFVYYTYVFFILSYTYYKLFNLMGYQVTYREMLGVRGASYLLTAINAGVGQGGLALWISRKKGIPLRQVISTLLILPVADVMFMAIVLTVSLAAHRISGDLLPPKSARIVSWAVAVLWVLIGLHFAFWRSKRMEGRLNFIRNRGLLQGYRQAKTSYYFVILAARMAADLPAIGAFYIGLRWFAGGVPFGDFVVRFFPTIILQTLPITVGQLGTSQSAWVLMFGEYAEASALAAFSLVWITFYNISRIVIGAICFRGEARHYLEQITRDSPD